MLLTNCSFDDKTGIWDGLESDEKRAKRIENEQNRTVEIVQTYSSQNIYSEEIKPIKSINLIKAKKNISWKTSNLNNQNTTGNIFLESAEHDVIITFF